MAELDGEMLHHVLRIELVGVKEADVDFDQAFVLDHGHHDLLLRVS